MDEALHDAALDYHEYPTPGKISVTSTKGLANQRDLSLAYSPGVAAPCLAIQKDPLLAARYTSRGNLVGVITNGTAVLGLGDIGPLASKPVMEGKGCLFKKFAGIDVFDIELDERDPDKLVDIIAALQPTLGGINLEDIKAPECFYIEKKLRERLSIPVFHDDQHGTAIISSAALINGLKVVGKKIGEVKLVASGAGAAAIACLNLMVDLGIKRENVYVCDSKGLIYAGRDANMEANKARYAQADTGLRTLADVMPGADIFLGCSAAGALKPAMIKDMARQPLILALANPEPEIRPEEAKAVRPDAIIATGRSDYPNQVNNVLCFPFIFRGALDVGATTINEAMKLATVKAIAALAEEAGNDEVARAYGGEKLEFGPDYIIPRPFDPRLIVRIAPAVAQAAMDSGVATQPILDMAAYRAKLESFVYHTGMIMRPVFSAAKKIHSDSPKRVIYCEGEDERVLHAAQTVIDEALAKPVLIGRAAVIAEKLAELGLRMRAGTDFEVVDPQTDSRLETAAAAYHEQMGRRGFSPEASLLAVRRSHTLFGALLVNAGQADAMLCGLVGRYQSHLEHVQNVIGRQAGVNLLAAMNLLILPGRNLFVCDTYVNADPGAEEIAAMTLLAADEVRRFGLQPKVALISHSNFGTSELPSASKMRVARALVAAMDPELEVDGEMQIDSALDEELRRRTYPGSKLKGEANLLVMPTLDAANITFNALKITGSSGVTVGPILLGTAKPAHILTANSTARRLLNMTALAVLDSHHKR